MKNEGGLMQSQQITFETVLTLVKQLSLTDQIRLLEWIVARLKSMFYGGDALNENQQIKKKDVSIQDKAWLKLAGTISYDDLQIMAKEIESECGKVDIHEW
ncbi:hypothetical protein QUF58_03080 [Anaerolineales bacterium HSG24]|nr:hypothetical protein [Anaerolineales bacterium HSG24]